MRRGIRKTKQVIAGILSAALLMTSLPQNSTYVYATEQAEIYATDEITQTQTETEKISDVQTDSTTNEETQLQIEAETNKTDNSENAKTETETTQTQDSEKTGTEEETSKTETEDSQDKSKSEEINETQASIEENDTETQEESSELEETTKSEESEIESEIKELETEYENKTNTQMKIVEGELAGVYQFGDFPVGESEKDKITTYSMNLTADTNLSELEDYLYCQMKKRNEIIDVESYQISIEEMGKIITGVLNENPDLYFVNRSYRFSHYEGDTLTIEVKLTYDNSLNEEAFQKAVEEALLVVKSDMSDFEKAVILHDYLALNCEYDEENYEAGTIPNVSYSAYGVLVNRTAVCQGYALAYKYLLNQLGINCYMVISREMDHGWNLIELNGEYYQVDVTWDDPTCDLIGRVCHKYMFRSDNDFVNECKHHDWSVTKGSEVIDYKAVDTTYDTAFWLECNSPLALVNKECYYVGFNEQKNKGVINKASILDSGQKGIEICEIGEWTVWGKDYGCYTSAYSGLFQANNRLYFNDKTSIYSIDLNDVGNKIDKRTEFTADTASGYIYGSAFCQGKVLYSLRQKPSITSKGEETILTADITIETEKPSEIPVEKIELDKETLKLTVGSAAKLQTTVTPDNATDANVTWKSSDDSIATVEDGTVTAIAVGSCTITAVAGGKEAVCNVTVNASEDNIASGESKDITWVINADGKLTVEGTGNFAYGNDNMAPWYSQRLSIKSAEINVTGMTNAERMFYGCENLTNLDMDKFDTTNVTDMGWMFYGCSSLESLDVSKFDTSNVTRMKWMFGQCSSLESLNVGKFDTSNVTDMNGMFGYCSNLKSLDVSKFDTSNVTDMECMFRYCEGLENLDVAGFDTSNVTDMGGIFEGCSSLKSLDVAGFNTSNVTDMGSMFIGCSSLESLDVGNFDTGKVTNMRHMFNSCNSLESLDVGNFDTSNVKSMYGMFAGCRSLKSLNMSKFDTSKINDMNCMFDIDSCRSLISLRTPCNINGLVNLPKLEITDIWFDKDGNEYEELPQNLNYSILIKKNEIPIISAIKATKIKTNYVCGDTINIDDLTVTYYDVDSIARELEESLYTTNADEIDMSTAGNKTLIIIYNDGRNVITDEIELTVTEKEPENIIASGEYKENGNNITWIIDADGKLTVEGTGDFSDDYGLERAPWYNDRKSIKYAEVNVTGMTNASQMFYECEYIISINLEEFDTSKVTKMGYMFCGCSSLMSLDLSGFDTSNVTNMNDMFLGCRNLTSLDLSSFDTGNVSDMNNMFAGCSSLTSLDLSSFDTSNVSCMNVMFAECSSLTDLDLSSFDTSNVTKINNMFYRCSSLTSLDVSGFDTSNACWMGAMFWKCSSLTSLDLSSFNTSQVTDMESMFYGCSSLSELDLSGFDTSRVTNMSEMFDHCNSLISLDMSNFDISDVTDMDNIFNECSKLLILHTPYNLKLSVALPSGTWYQTDGTQITELPQNLDHSILIKKDEIPIVSAIKATKTKTDYVCGDTINVDDLTVTYYDVDSIARELEESQYSTNADEIDMSTVGNKTLIITYNDDGNAITDEIELTVTKKEPENIIASGKYIENDNDITWVIDADGKLTVEGTGNFAGNSHSAARAPWYDNGEFIQYAEINVSSITDASYMFNGCKNLTSVDLDNFNTSHVTNMRGMFTGCNSLTSVDLNSCNTSRVTDMSSMFMGCNKLSELDLSNFDTSQVKDMRWMFCGCSNLTSLDLSNFDTSQVKDMSIMFNGCSSLINLDISNFDTSQVTDMISMFSGCSTLTSLDMSNFDTSQVTDMISMFNRCSTLTSLDMSNFDTSQVTNMAYMFRDCSNLKDLDLRNFNTSQVTDMSSMFSGCSTLTSLDVGNFDTSQVTSMSHMFSADGSSLTYLNVDNFDTSQVTNMEWMFYGCSDLTKLDVSNFDTSQVTNMEYMFTACGSLTDLDVSNFDTSQVTNMKAMFLWCSSLTNLNMSNFDTSQVTGMGRMFEGCNSLTNLNVGRFNTSQVTDMSSMFSRCSTLTSLDMSNFDTSQVTNMGWMFHGCSSLISMDMSNFDLSKVEKIQGMIDNCSKLITIYTPRNLKQSVPLPLAGTKTAWYQPDGTEITELPQDLDYSIKITKNKIPSVSDPYITVQKTKKAYECGDILNTDDLTVTYYNSDGIAETVTDYTTNANEIDMSVQGIKILTVTYNGLTAEVELTVTSSTTTDPDKENYKVTFDLQGHGTALEEYATYTAIPKGTTITRPTSPEAEGYQFTGWYKDLDCKTPWDFEKDTIEEDTTLYAGWEITETAPVPDQQTYAVTFNLQGHGTALEEYATYTEIPKGTTIIRPTSPEAEGYQFTGWYKDPNCKTLWDFEKDTIEENTTLYAGWEITETDPNPDQRTYTVTFNLQGHGTILEEYLTYTAIPKGTTITLPTSPEAEGYQFTGWYKDPNCKTLWDFEKDTIEEDTTLYAGWKLNDSSDDDNPPEEIPDGIWIAQIKDYTYTGKPIIPSVIVYFNKKKLTAGQDYTITYQNNTKASLASAAKAPTVIVKGKGNYAGTKKATFTINKMQLTEESNLKAAKVYPIGVKYTPMVTANGNVLKSGTDYKLAYCDAYGNELKKQPIKAGNYQLHITGKGNCEGEIIFAYSVSESGGANAISKGTATIANYIYGNEEPKVTLSVDGKTLTRDTDYLVSFANTYKKGTATATFIGIGNYTGTIKKNFKVQAAAIQPNNIVVAKTAAYEKGGARAEVSVSVNGAELVLGTDYTATYKKNTKLGTASVIIKGKGNYTGSQTKEFKVEPKSLTADGVKIYVSDVQTGKKPAITLYDTNGKKLVANNDYKAEIDKAAHKVTISAGKNGLYKTETPITISYQELERGKQVTSAALNKKSNTLPKFFEYTGKEIVLEKDWLTVKAGKTVLKSDEFEILGYVNNTKKGTATVIIKGCNEYGGIKMLNFKIKARDLFYER